jgi:hypothetical protein
LPDKKWLLLLEIIMEVVMRRSAAVAFAFTILICGMAHADEKKAVQSPLKPSFRGSFQLGYAGGTGAQANISVADLARDFPLVMRFGIAYLKTDPGNPAEARINFINDATNGTPEESGHVWDFRLDFLYPVHWLGLKRGYFLVGPRYSRFTGTFNYIGGNEKFDITADQLGLGVGLESYFAMNNKMDLIMGGGIDNYFNSTLEGHDTSYSPNGESVNGRDGYDYSSADKAVNQPKFEFRLMMGIAYSF